MVFSLVLQVDLGREIVCRQEAGADSPPKAMQCHATCATSCGGGGQTLSQCLPLVFVTFRSVSMCLMAFCDPPPLTTLNMYKTRQVRGGSAAVPGHLANLRGAEDGDADEGNLHRAQGGEASRPEAMDRCLGAYIAQLVVLCVGR